MEFVFVYIAFAVERADRCRALADLSQMPSVSRRLRVLAQSYTERAQGIELPSTLTTGGSWSTFKRSTAGSLSRPTADAPSRRGV